MSTEFNLEEKQVRDQVAAALSANQSCGCSLSVEAVVRHPDFWQVAVKPDREGVRAEDYARVLTDVEDQLRDQQGLTVVLTPVLV